MADIWKHPQGANFCPRCGTLLVFTDAGAVSCDKCDYSCGIKDLPTLSVVTVSYAKPLPEWLVDYRATHAGEAVASKEAKKARATVNEECPKCKNPVMEYYTMQLRSADEGQTVFYECAKCGHKHSVNT